MFEDVYQSAPPQATYRERCAQFRQLVLDTPGKDAYTEMIRLAAGVEPDEALIRESARRLDARVDCADFSLNGLLPLLYRFRDSRLWSEDTKRAVESAVLGFKYWPDEPGIDNMCTWTENHQIMFAAGGYLAGQRYPDRLFTNSDRKGREQMEVFRPRIRRWLKLRFRTGFSEWLSNVYYNEDFPPLLNLVEFAADRDIRLKAAMVVDLMILDLVSNHFRGTLGSSHGRSYERYKKNGERESTGSVLKLVCGMGRYRAFNMSAINLVLSRQYRVPAVLEAIGKAPFDQTGGGTAGRVDTSERGHAVGTIGKSGPATRPPIRRDPSAKADRREECTDELAFESKQRMGIRLDDARRWGLSYSSIEDGMVFLSLEAYLHSRTADLTLRMLDRFRWWENDFFRPFGKHRRLIGLLRRLGVIATLARLFRKDLTRNTREEVNLYSYRTPDYMLACAQDYRFGYGGDQHHTWQATLGPRAIVFTTHPGTLGADGESPTPNYWTGSGTLPRACAIKNVAIVVYRINTKPGLYRTNRLKFTHAWFPRDEFDEVREHSGWVFARKGRGYLALWSENPYRWRSPAARDRVPTESSKASAETREIVVDGKRNVYICEMGRPTTHGRFDDFVSAVSAAPVTVSRRSVRYVSPSLGTVILRADGNLSVDGSAVPTRDYPRYDTEFVDAPFPADRVTARHENAHLILDWNELRRDASGYLEGEP